MKVLYFDCFSGISGDMTLGALIDLGIDKELFKSELDKLNLAGYEIIIEKKEKNGIIGTDVNVLVNEDYEELQNKVRHHQHEAYNHSHRHDKHNHYHKRHHHSHPARNLTDIETLIDESDLRIGVKDFSKKVFREIAEAEAKVHNKSINQIHFHEVGAVDSIVDIVGTAICIDLLGVERVFSSPIHEGRGFIECQHGILPVPVPAVMEMLRGTKIPVITEDINTELVTPTGMGLVKCMAESFGSMPAMVVDCIGYGMGKRETGRFNAVRVVMGTLFSQGDALDEIAVLETNIDDMSPEVLGFTVEKLLESGALDAFYTPVYMKKSRPGVMLTVLSNKEDEEKLADIILRETTTLGIRRSTSQRYCMDRETVKVETGYGQVRVKVAARGELKKFSPEYEDCRKIAQSSGIPLREVYNTVCKRYEEEN